MLIYQFTKNKLMPIAPMDLETLNYYLHTKNDYVNKLGVVYNKAGQKICEIDTYSFVEKAIDSESIEEENKDYGYIADDQIEGD